jgi:GH24 family phage-related lysozyme (muramidase)
MSDNGRRLLMEREGVKLTAYQDSKGIWTIGVGHTSVAGPPTVTPGLTITREEVEEIFERDIAKFENGVSARLKREVNQHQFDALVSIAYNIGLGGFGGSTFLRHINDGLIEAAADAILMWNKPPEIIGRRRAEAEQFLDLQHVARV